MAETKKITKEFSEIAKMRRSMNNLTNAKIHDVKQIFTNYDDGDILIETIHRYYICQAKCWSMIQFIDHVCDDGSWVTINYLNKKMTKDYYLNRISLFSHELKKGYIKLPFSFLSWERYLSHSNDKDSAFNENLVNENIDEFFNVLLLAEEENLTEYITKYIYFYED